MNTIKYISLEHSRATVFNLFTALFCQPEEEMISDKKIFTALTDAFKVASPGLSLKAQQLSETISKYTQKELLIEYSRLFVGPFKLPAPPYSSLYFGSEELMSDETMWVINFFRKAGLEINFKKITDVPDHVAIECEFIYYLIFHEVKFLRQAKKRKAFDCWYKQKTFLGRHFNKWVPKFCGKIIENTGNEYYKALAECFRTFITSAEIPEFPYKISNFTTLMSYA